MDIEKTKNFLINRFLKGDKNHYICLETDNYFLTKASVMGALNAEYGYGMSDGYNAINNCFMRPWSGKKVYAPNKSKVVMERGFIT